MYVTPRSLAHTQLTPEPLTTLPFQFYRAWGHELTPERTPFETGLSFAVDFDTPNKDFIGREALLKARYQPQHPAWACAVRRRRDPLLVDFPSCTTATRH